MKLTPKYIDFDKYYELENFTINDYRKMLEDKMFELEESYNMTKEKLELINEWLDELEGKTEIKTIDDGLDRTICFSKGSIESCRGKKEYKVNKQILEWLSKLKEIRDSKNINQESSETIESTK